MNEGDRVLLSKRPAAVDHFLAAPLHFGVVALDAGKIELLVSQAACHGTGGAAPKPDQHGRPSQHDKLVAGIDGALLNMIGPDVAESPGEHDRFVVTAQLRPVASGHLRLERAEVAVDIRTAELVVESGPAKRSVDHDLQRGDDALRFPVLLFPRTNGPGQF